jgi:flagellar biosynthesis protein FlhB
LFIAQADLPLTSFVLSRLLSFLLLDISRILNNYISKNLNILSSPHLLSLIIVLLLKVHKLSLPFLFLLLIENSHLQHMFKKGTLLVPLVILRLVPSYQTMFKIL